MQIAEARIAVDQILNEECVRPTIHYEDIANEWVKRYEQMTAEEIQAWNKITSVPRKNLYTQREEIPRSVTETPQIFQLNSSNFDLLMAVLCRVEDPQRPLLIDYILKRVALGGICLSPKPEDYTFPSFAGKVCELPLIAEFCVRTGNAAPLFAATAKPTLPTAGLTIMMIQLEETIALNWDLFSDDQLAAVPEWLAPLREIADRQTHSARGTRGGPMVSNPHYKSGYEYVGNRIVIAIDAIQKECAQARFWYLKGALQRTVNFEIESDKAKVETFLVTLGFSNDMARALNAAEKDYRSSTNPFELKSSLGHLRSFLEHLHREAAKAISAANGTPIKDRWGDATLYLRQRGYFTKQHEDFVTALYTLISDASVHPLGAEREYARLLRNVVIEYGVMFLSALAKKGVKVG